MNKTYIKRQLILNELGIPMNKEVQEYVDLLNELIGEPNELKKEYGEYYDNKGYMYSKNKTKILFYDKKNELFCVDYDIIWIKFEQFFELNYKEISNLLSCLLEEAFKCKVTTAAIAGGMSLFPLEEAFKCKVTTAGIMYTNQFALLEEAFKCNVTTAVSANPNDHEVVGGSFQINK